jgi:hypothetical protein
MVGKTPRITISLMRGAEHSGDTMLPRVGIMRALAGLRRRRARSGPSNIGACARCK